MGRKVSVALTADVAGFVRPVETAKKATDDLGDKVAKLDRELDKIPADAAKAAAAMKLLGGEATAAGTKVGDIGTKGTKLTLLDAKLRETRAEVRKLADEFTKTGDVDVFHRLGDAQGRLTALSKIRKGVADSIEFGVEDGVKGAAQTPGLQQIGLGLGAALAVPLIAGLGGALAGVTGFAVAGVGILGAVLGDPQRFQVAWSRTLNDLQAQFINATRPLTDDTIHALSTIGPMVSSWHLNDLFDDASKYVEPLVRGIEGFATGAIRGASALVEKGGPAVDALSQGLGRLGIAAGNALSDIADGAEGGALALHDTIDAVATLVEIFGKVTGAAEKTYGFIREHPFAAALGSAGLTLPISIWTGFDNTVSHLSTTEYGLRLEAEKLGHVFNQQGIDLTVLQQRLNSTTVSADGLAGAMTNKVFSALMSLDQATLGIAESQTQVQETFEESRKTLSRHADQLDINTKQGQANRESVLASVTANMELYQAQIQAGMSAEDAAAAYDANTASLEKQLRKAGLTQQQIDGLIGKYREVPDKVNTAIAIEGLTNAIDNLNRTIQLIAGIKSKDVYVRIHNQVYDETTGRRQTGNSRLGADTSEHGRIRYRAAEGMIVSPSMPGTMLFGEPATGGEAYIPLRGISQSRAMGLAQTVGDSYGFSVSSSRGSGLALTLVFSGGNDDFLNRAVQRGFSDGRIQVYAGGQRVQARP